MRIPAITAASEMRPIKSFFPKELAIDLDPANITVLAIFKKMN